MSDPDHPGEPMSNSIEMTADEPPGPSFGGGATRVLSENELDGLLEATVSATDLNHPRAPKETKRIEALARIEPVTPGAAAPESGATTAAAEAALLDAAYSGSLIVVDATTKAPEISRPVAPTSRRSWWAQAIWIAVIIAASLGAGAALRVLL
jgi:hypothetical protein